MNVTLQSINWKLDETQHYFLFNNGAMQLPPVTTGKPAWLLFSENIQGQLEVHNRMLPEVMTQFSTLQDSLDRLRKEFCLGETRPRPGLSSKQALRDLLQVKDPAFWLEVLGEFPSPVCKGKFFSFEVILRGHRLSKSESLGVSLCLYTAEACPRIISHSMNGQKLLKGQTTARLEYDREAEAHRASFKVQMNEVTSHFRNGWVFMVVLPDQSKFLRSTGLTVVPLIIEHFVSKAKEITCRRYRRKWGLDSPEK